MNDPAKIAGGAQYCRRPFETCGLRNADLQTLQFISTAAGITFRPARAGPTRPTHRRLESKMLTTLKARFSSWLAYRRTCRELDALDSRELDDMGIARWQIPEIARRSTYGR